MADLRISDLVTASQLKDDDYYEIAQAESGTRVSYRTTLLAIAVQIATVVQLTSDLTTDSKTLAGAINELKRQIALIPGFTIVKVNSLPTEDIDTHTLYLVPSQDPAAQNSCDEYINTDGTTAGWELIGSTDIDLSDYYTKLEVDGLLANKANVADLALKENKTDMPTDVRTIIKDCKTPKSATITNGIAQFECIEENLVKGLKVTMNPIQDLHGYSNPWAGGAGKNKLHCSLQEIKSVNTSGSWNGNVYTLNGSTFTVYTLPDNDTVIKVTTSGTQSGTTSFYVGTMSFEDGVSEIMNGCPSGGSSSKYQLVSSNSSAVGYDRGNGVTITPSATVTSAVRIYLYSGYDGNSLDWYPMIRLSTVTDATFAPYSNICPISGRTEASVFESGINLWDLSACIRAYISTNGTTVAENKNYLCDKFYFVKKGKSITLSSKNACTRMSISVFNASFNFIERNQVSDVKQTSYTATDDCYVKVHFNYDNTDRTVDEWNALCETIELQLQLGDIVLPYESFKKYTAITHQYQQEIMGGVDDFVNGGLTNEWVLAEYDGSEAWGKASSATWNVFFVELADAATGSVSDIRSDSTNISIYSFSQMVENAPCISIRTNLTPNRLHIAIPNVATIDECKAYLADHNLQVCYKKATPTTIQTSAEDITTVAGTNIISGTEPISECKYTELATVDDLIKIIGGQ